MHCLHTLMMASTKQNLPCAFAFKSKLLICTSSGGAFDTYEDNALILKLSHTFIPIENFNMFVINHQKGGRL